MRLADEAAEDMCANKSVGDTENNVAADVKACADEAVDVGDKTCVDDAAGNIGDPSVDENAVLENVVGNANELGDVAIVGADDKMNRKQPRFVPRPASQSGPVQGSTTKVEKRLTMTTSPLNSLPSRCSMDRWPTMDQ